MPEWTHDPVIPKFVPDPELMARCQRAQMADEAELCSPAQRYVRQQYEMAFSATRVALDAMRAIWPVEADALHEDAHERAHAAQEGLTLVYATLDGMAEYFYHSLLLVQRGHITTHEQLDELGVPR